MMPSAVRKGGLVLLGVVMGLFALAIGTYVYLEAAQETRVYTQITEHVDISSGSIDDIDVIEQDAIRFTLRDIALLDANGETIAAAPRALLTLDVPSFNGDGAIEFYDVELVEPTVNLLQSPSGDWNFTQVMALTAAGEPVESEESRPILLRDVAIRDGDLVIAMPAPAPEGPAEPASALAMNLPTTFIGGVPYRRYAVSDVQGDLPAIRVGGGDGWRVEVGNLTGVVEEPALRIAELQGWAEQEGEEGFAFELASLHFGDSRLSGDGSVRITEEGPLYDLTLRAAPLLTSDLRAIFPTFPDDGRATFALDVQSVSAERHGLIFRGLDASIAGSRLLGDVGLAVGGDLPPGLLAAALELAPLDLQTLESLGLVEEVPFLGRITGRVTTAGAAPGFAEVSLTGAITPRDQPDVPPSNIFATGEIALGGATDALRLDGLALSFQPLHLAAFRGMAPEQAERLRGEVRGSVLLAGTLADLRLAGGDLSYQVGEEPPTRLTGLTGRIGMNPMVYDFRAVASPLSLATLTELFPGLPFRTGTLSGPIEISGGPNGLDVQADLNGPSGGIQLTGSVDLGEVPTFDFSGRLRAFEAGMVLRPDLPVSGPLTGSFAARGSTDLFSFEVDLAQAEGSFALVGSANFTAEPARFDIAGNVMNFRVGSLLGNPALFPDPMTGPIAISGGGGEPYTFDLDLQGAAARLDLQGTYRPGDLASYEIQGEVVGLDLSALPLPRRLPSTALTGRVDIRGSGTDLETLAGSYSFDLSNSVVSNMALDAALGRIEIVNGIALVDTLYLQLERSVLSATGSWGLRTPAAEPLRFAFSSPDLSHLSRLIAPDELVPPIMTGNLTAAGMVAGSVEFPQIEGELTGRGLRFEEWRAATLELTLDISKDAAVGWGGQVALTGDELALPRLGTLEAVQLETSGDQNALAVGLFARRDAGSDLAMSGILELGGLRPQGIGLQTMALRAEGMEWNLLSPARLRYVGDEGLLIENLVLQRGGAGGEGTLTVDGMLPPTGNADLRISAQNVDMADFHRITPAAPAVEGRLFLDLALDGPVADPILTLNGRLDQLRYEGVTTETIALELDYRTGALTGSAEALAGGRSLFRADMNVPALLSMENRLIPSMQFQETAPIEVTLRADSLPLDIAAAMVPGITEGIGTLRAQIDVGGTIDTPALQGWVRVDNGALSVERSAVRYSDIQVDIQLANNQATINNFSVVSGGTLTAAGSIDFPSVSAPIFDLTVDLSEFLVMDDPELAELVTSGQLSITGPVGRPVVRGAMDIHDSTIQVPEMGEAEPELALAYADIGSIGATPEGDLIIPAPVLGNVQVDGVELGFDESVWLESDDMRVQIDGDLVVYRTGEELRVFGQLLALRGTYRLQLSGIVREFDVLQGRVQFFGTGQLDPSLDILAGYRVRASTVGQGGDLTILVNLTGTLLAPRIQLRADTPVQLSEADLISYLMFGQPSFELGQLTQSFAEQVLVQELVGGILATELESLLTGDLCDWVRVRPGVSSNFRGVFQGGALTNAAIECGRELTSSLFLTAQANLGGLFDAGFTSGRIGLEWEIDREWSLQASYGTLERDAIFRIFDQHIRTQFSTDLRREWEYGRPTRRSTIDLTPDADPAAPGAAPPPPPEVIPQPAPVQ